MWGWGGQRDRDREPAETVTHVPQTQRGGGIPCRQNRHTLSPLQVRFAEFAVAPPSMGLLSRCESRRGSSVHVMMIPNPAREPRSENARAGEKERESARARELRLPAEKAIVSGVREGDQPLEI